MPFPQFLTLSIANVRAGKALDALAYCEGIAHVQRPRTSVGSRSWFTRSLETVGLERITVHDLRGGAASLATRRDRRVLPESCQVQRPRSDEHAAIPVFSTARRTQELDATTGADLLSELGPRHRGLGRIIGIQQVDHEELGVADALLYWPMPDQQRVSHLIHALSPLEGG